MSVPPSPRYKRILLKLSGEALMGEQNFGIDPAVTTAIAADIKEITRLGVEVVQRRGHALVHLRKQCLEIVDIHRSCLQQRS